MPTKKDKSLLSRTVLVNALVLAVCAITAAQITTTKPPNPNITVPSPQRHQPAGGQHPVSPSSQVATVPPATSVQLVRQGVIAGYVYWDTKSVSHVPAGSCGGLGAAVNVGTPAKGAPGFEQFKMLGTYHNFTYMGTVGSWTVCAYSVQQVPTGQDLQVMVNFKQPSFTPLVNASVPPTANNPNQPINIPGGTCNKVPPSVPSAAVLGSGWWTCGINAYNVNFVVQPTTAANMSSGGLQITVVSGTPQGTAQQPQHSTNPGMLGANNASRGMLLPANPTGAQSNSQPGTPGQLLLSKSGGGTVQLNPQPLPPKGTGPSQTMSAGSMSSSGINSSPAQGGNRPVDAAPYTGTVSGFIYWDTSQTGFESSCNGVAVYANLDHGKWGSWQGAAGNLTYSPDGPLAVCAYTITGVPIGVPLDIGPGVSWAYKAFGVNLWSLAGSGDQSGWSVGWGGQFLGEYDVITVQKTSCQALVSSKNLGSQSNLQSGPRSCGNQAANVNLTLVSTPPQLSSGTSGGPGNAATSRIAGAKRGGPNRILLDPQPASSAQK